MFSSSFLLSVDFHSELSSLQPGFSTSERDFSETPSTLVVFVSHERTAHNYLGDMTAETDVYTKTSSLLAMLDQWAPTKDASTLPEVIFELWIELYEHDYIELHDVETVKEYLRTLIAIGYEFPKLNNKKYSLPQKQPSVLGQPFRSFPHFTTIDSLDSVGDGGWWSKMDWSSRSDSAVVKVIMMTMNEWPLVKRWVLVSPSAVS